MRPTVTDHVSALFWEIKSYKFYRINMFILNVLNQELLNGGVHNSSIDSVCIFGSASQDSPEISGRIILAGTSRDFGHTIYGVTRWWPRSLVGWNTESVTQEYHDSLL
jgi:hypothetical protein